MTPTEVLARCSAAGIRLQPAGDGLTIDAPAGSLTAKLVTDLRTHKAELLALLRPATAAPATGNSNGPESIDARAVWHAALDRLAGELPPAVMAACRAADVRWEPDTAGGPDLDADGWPAGSVTPQDCPTCPGLLTWQDVGGRWRCERCDADALARSTRLADATARARKRWPAKPTPRAAPGGKPGGAGLTEPKRSV